MRTLTVYFDGWCPLCQKSKRFLEQLDRFDQLTFIDARQVRTFEQPVLLERMHVETEQGVRYAGIHGIRLLTKTLPFLRPAYPFVSLSIRVGIGAVIYDRVAKNRVIPVSCTTDCRIN
jgi:predicted DCC family thiol-disulfide oxidoreductase YuxK